MTEEKTQPTPLLVRAGLILLALNFVFVLWFSISPNISESNYTRKAPQSYQLTAHKGSPFEPAPVENKRKGSKLPPKLEPIIAQIIPEVTIPPTGSVD